MSETVEPVQQAEAILRRRLREAGIDPDGVYQPSSVWHVFKEFVTEVRFDTDSDGVLYECGVFHFGGHENLHFSFVRQLQAYSAEKPQGWLEQTSCEFLFDPTDVLGASTNTWWFREDQTSTFESWAAEVEQRPEFKALSRRRPRRAYITHDVV